MECGDGVFFNYSFASTLQDMVPLYLQLLFDTDYANLGLDPLKILVFSGDDDSVSFSHTF